MRFNSAQRRERRRILFHASGPASLVESRVAFQFWLTPCCFAVLIACLVEVWPYRRWPIGNSKPGFLPIMQGLCASQLMVLAVYSYAGAVGVEATAIYAVA